MEKVAPYKVPTLVFPWRFQGKLAEMLVKISLLFTPLLCLRVCLRVYKYPRDSRWSILTNLPHNKTSSLLLNSIIKTSSLQNPTMLFNIAATTLLFLGFVQAAPTLVEARAGECPPLAPWRVSADPVNAYFNLCTAYDTTWVSFLSSGHMKYFANFDA